MDGNEAEAAREDDYGNVSGPASEKSDLHDEENDLGNDWFEVEQTPVRYEARGPYFEARVIPTLDGDFRVSEEFAENGYYVVRGVEGEIYPESKSVFEATHKKAVGPRPMDEVLANEGGVNFDGEDERTRVSRAGIQHRSVDAAALDEEVTIRLYGGDFEDAEGMEIPIGELISENVNRVDLAVDDDVLARVVRENPGQSVDGDVVETDE